MEGEAMIMDTPIDLIKTSNETGIRILTTDKERARFLMRESEQSGLGLIAPPLTTDVNFDYFENIKEVIVDNPKLVIEKLTGKKVINQF